MSNTTDLVQHEINIGQVMSVDAALVDAKNRGLTQATFEAFAFTAMEKAAALDDSKGDKRPRLETFNTELIALCTQAGDTIPRRFVQVADRSVKGWSKWALGVTGRPRLCFTLHSPMRHCRSTPYMGINAPAPSRYETL